MGILFTQLILFVDKNSHLTLVAGVSAGIVHVATPPTVPVARPPVLWASLGALSDELWPLLHLASAALAFGF